MSDTSTTALSPIPSATAEAFSKLGPDAAASTYVQLKGFGYDVSKLAQGQVTVPAVAATPAAPDKPAANSKQVKQWQSLQKGWTGNPQIVLDAAKAAGVDLEAIDAAAAAAPTSADRQAAAVAKAIAPAENYDKLIHSNSRELSPEALGRQDTFFKNVFAKLGVPALNVQPLLESLLAAQALYPPLAEGADQDDIDKRIMVEKDTRLLQGSVIRGLQDKNIARDAQIAIDAIKTADPKAHDTLYNSGAFMSAAAFHQLALIGRVLSARKAK